MRDEIESVFDKLWPINRSLTGHGNRETLKILDEVTALHFHEEDSGTDCYDWKIPPEWNVFEAYIEDEKGNRVIDFRNNNLHVVGYSVGVDIVLSFNQLKEHLYYLDEHPDWIPYKTAYYKRIWGFCLSYNTFKTLDQDVKYHVVIKADHDPEGSMTYADRLIKGDLEEEILFSTYICHPSMANNELSGPLVTIFLQRELEKRLNRRFSYRFFYGPETIGAVNYLHKNEKHLLSHLKGVMVVTTVGDAGEFTYKLSKKGNSAIDRIVQIILRQDYPNAIVEKYSPSGSDERQYGSPGFNFEVSSLMRTRYLKYEEYHTSADNKSFVSFEAMEETVNVYLKIIEFLENNYVFKRLIPNCEPHLSKWGLYTDIKSSPERHKEVLAYKWILALSDGVMSFLDIVEQSEMPYELMIRAANILRAKGLIGDIKT